MVGALGQWAREGAGLAEIGSRLDGLDPVARRTAVTGVTRADQRALFRLAGEAPELGDEHFVPAARGVLRPVVHHGWNSLPLPRPARAFRKVFARATDGTLVYGYNDSPLRVLIGPGYYVVAPVPDVPVLRDLGTLMIDYYRVPAVAVPPEWPRVRPNWWGLQFFVYHRTRDVMRRLSTHVSIGAATKFGRSLDHYFLLCRED